MDRHTPGVAPIAQSGPGSAPKIADPYQTDETPTRWLDRIAQTSVSPAFGNLSPISLGLAMADWAWHLAAAPGRQLELAGLAARLALDTAQMRDASEGRVGTRDEDPRFRAEEWTAWPFSQWRIGFRNAEVFWREASRVPGVSKHHREMVEFFSRQWLDMLSPANRLVTNPVLLRHTAESGGGNLARGALNWLADATGVPTLEDLENRDRFVVGGNVAITPGKVIYRNRLVELIRYVPQTGTVHPEPLFIVPSWIMKYYILDLSPHNSMVKYLVEQGHTVYMLSWRNPDETDCELSMDDYLQTGVFDPMRAAAHDADGAPMHAMGYCLGATLLAIAVCALARDGGMAGYTDLPAPKTLTILAGQVDFYRPGELGLFIDEGQISLLDNITRGQGFLSGKQMAGSFQFLHSRDLVWSRRMREYLMGERDQDNDLMAWNADTTRLPARMHHEYLVALYLKNALANGRYVAGGRRVSLSDLRMPIFLVGTERDHVSPWRSVYKLHQLASTEITFLLVSGGHNAGIVSPPGQPRRRYRRATQARDAQWLTIDEWLARAEAHEGSWWPAWQAWLAEHSGPRIEAVPIPEDRVVCDAPGDYVMQRYPE